MKMEIIPLSVVVFLSLIWVEERNASLPYDISCIDRWVLYHLHDLGNLDVFGFFH